MRIIIVDDEIVAIRRLERTIRIIDEKHEIYSADNYSEALELCKNKSIEVAFLDIEMPLMNGLELALEINKINNSIKIVFVTGYRDYAYDAFKIKAYDYVLKPFNRDDIEGVLKGIKGKDIYIKTAGHFEVLVDGVPIKFKTTKSKELLAILVDGKGSYLTSEYIITYLWPDREFDEKVKNLYRRALKDLRDVLIENHIENIIMDFRNQRAINMDAFRTDPYDIENYMISYDW